MINKKKNVMLQITFPKDDAKHLETLKNAFEKEGIKVSKSDILLQAFRDYLKIILSLGKASNDEKQKEENENA